MLIDPLGFGLENYDPIGRWRDRTRAQPIDATGEIAGHRRCAFNNPAELATALQKDPRFARCMTRKLLTYAVGRGMEPADTPALDVLTERFAAGGYRFRALVETIATSPLMTIRGGRAPSHEHRHARNHVAASVLSRRAALRGLGVTMALPWLEAMAPRKAPAQAAAPLRFLTVFAAARRAHAGLDAQDHRAPATP